MLKQFGRHGVKIPISRKESLPRMRGACGRELGEEILPGSGDAAFQDAAGLKRQPAPIDYIV
jgi:hypothetical protein